MSMRDLESLVEMGGYALYVWSAFAMCAAAALWDAVLLRHRRRLAQEDLDDHLGRSDAGGKEGHDGA
ncbi:MAG TPA: heme exporter protein CcmD [Burkholderiaceae bacterium]|nr:heme exporter protein CcmD [Burkholderiaceae bacterium]